MSGGAPAEFLDGSHSGEERQGHSSHYVPVPELRVLGIVRNPAKPEWCLGLREEFEPTAISFFADWAGGPPDSTWSCSPNSAEVIFIRHFAKLRESSPGATMSLPWACGPRMGMKAHCQGLLIPNGLPCDFRREMKCLAFTANTRFAGLASRQHSKAQAGGKR